MLGVGAAALEVKLGNWVWGNKRGEKVCKQLTLVSDKYGLSSFAL